MSTYKIIINDSLYNIGSLEAFNNIKKNIFENLTKNKHLNDNTSLKYTIIFYIDNLKDLEIFIYNREYIVDLIEDININNFYLSFNKFKI
jgi:hypothetical protein